MINGTNVKWGLIGSLFVGVPAYIVGYAWARIIGMVNSAFTYLVVGPFEFVARMIDIAFADAVRGIDAANVSFQVAAYDAGLLAAIIGAVGTVIVLYAAYRGVLLLG